MTKMMVLLAVLGVTIAGCDMDPPEGFATKEVRLVEEAYVQCLRELGMYRKTELPEILTTTSYTTTTILEYTLRFPTKDNTWDYQPSEFLIIQDENNEEMIKISFKTGEVIINPGMSTPDAAKFFWKVTSEAFPELRDMLCEQWLWDRKMKELEEED